MRHRLSILASLTTLLTLAGCVTDVEPETAELEQAATVPTIVDYRPGTVSSRMLVPDRYTPVHLVLIARQNGAGHYAWGLANGRAIWLYRVAEPYTPDFLATFNKAWVEIMGPGLGDGIAGFTRPPPPDPEDGPGPTGEPPYSSAYVDRLLQFSINYQKMNDELTNDLASGQY